MQRHAVEHLHAVATLNDKSFHDVEAVQLGPPPCHLRQIPTSRRWWSSRSFATVQRPAPIEDTADRANRRNAAPSTPGQLPVDGIRAELSQSTPFLQFAPHTEDQVLPVSRCLVDWLAAPRRPVREVHAVEPTVPGVGHPLLHRPQRGPTLSGNLPHRLPFTNRLDHPPTMLLLTVFRPS